MPRIISGRARGLHLQTPKGDRTRPTSDKVKEALFSIIMPYLNDADFLDLYAGSGQIGLEAVSRGAAKSVLIEHSTDSIRCIQANVEKTGFTSQVALMRAPVQAGLKSLADSGSRFDIIFLDPPWRQAIEDFVKYSTVLAGLLNPGGIIILEHESRHQAPDIVTELKCWKSCQYGSAMLSFYQLG